MPEKNEAAVRRVRPHSDEAERAVLGGLYIDNSQIPVAGDILPNGKAFYNRIYGSIYEAMLHLSASGRVIDMVTLQDRLKEMDVPPDVVNADLLRDVITSVPTAANVKHYVNIVSEKALLRELIAVTEDISEECYADKGDVDELMEKTEKKVFDVVQKRSVGKVTPIDSVVWDALESINRAAQTTGDVTGLATGFVDLDHWTAGLQPGNLVLVAARPAMGKTSLVLSILHNVVVKQHKPALMFSLEMSQKELMNRLLSMDSGVNSQKFKTGQLTDADWVLLMESGGNLAHSGLILNDTATTLGEIRSISRKMKAEKNIELVVVDYLQLMNSTSKRADSRQQEISEISRGMKLLVKELQLPVIALSQLSRSVESRTDHRPMLSDLRESGAIEQDADMVMFIYRDEVYHEDSDKKGIAEINIAKHRSGPVGVVELVWMAELTQFKNKEYR